MQHRKTMRATVWSLRLAPIALLVCTFAAGRNVYAQNAQYELRGERLMARFRVDNGSLKGLEATDLRDGATLKPGEVFRLQMRDGRTIAASQMKLEGMPIETPILAVSNAARRAEQIPGREVCADLSDPVARFTVHWCVIARKGTNYVREVATFTASANPVQIAAVRLFDFAAPGAKVVGSVSGSPLVTENFFFGFESPLSESAVANGRASAWLKRSLPLKAGQSIVYSSVIGVAEPGEMRRGFLAYLEDERAHPYRTFLNYNTWYDLGYSDRYDEAGALDRVRAFGEELVRKRSVTMDSFLFDDGWDDSRTLWHFNSGLPNGFSKVRALSEKYHSGIGVWLSPWGGYDQPKEERIAAGKKAGYETVQGGFALSAPKYYGLFEKTCLQMIAQYGVNQFKFDGTGNASQVFPGSLFDSDFSAMIHLIEKLRQQEPGIFINLSTGTWPSPFWLRYSDTIWRGGEDHDFAGVGTWRQRWITYRDADTYRHVVTQEPLYPLNSLMLHGVIFARNAEHLSRDPGNDFPDEVRDFFGSGTQLQELYITPSLLTEADWNVLAESAKWSRANAEVLKDTHWIGGDPGKLQVYGWASWTPEKGILVLRNPSDKTQAFSFDVGRAFELPIHAARAYRAHSPWSTDKNKLDVNLYVSKIQTIRLAPFQVLTLDVLPIQ